MKKLVLFDLDGTLINAAGAGRSALAKALQQLYSKSEGLTAELICGRTDTDNFALGYQLATGKKATKKDIQKIQALYLQLLPQEVQRVCKAKKYKLIPGVKKALQQLAKQKDVVLGLGTGNIQEGAKIKLAPSGLLPFFTCGGYGEAGHCREDMLRAAVKAAEKKYKTTFSPENIYVVGDTHRDILAAKNCGFHSAAITEGFGDKQFLQRAAAELEIKNFNELDVFLLWLGLQSDPKGVKRGVYISPASAIEHVFFSRTGIDEDRLKMLRIKKYSDLPSGTIM